MWFQHLTFMKIFWLVFLPQIKPISKVFLISRLSCELLLSFLSSKFILQLPNLSSFSFSFNFRFRLSFCLLYTTIQGLWNKVLFSGKTSASVNLFFRALHLLFNVFPKPSKLRNAFELSAFAWNFFRGQNLRKKYYVLHTNFKLQVLLFLSSKFQKIIFIFCRCNILILELFLYFLELHKLDWIDKTKMTNPQS